MKKSVYFALALLGLSTVQRMKRFSPIRRRCK